MRAHSVRTAEPKSSPFFSVRARLALVALILVLPLMFDRARTLEQSRASQVEAATADLAKSSRHSAEAQRAMISSVEALLKSIAYIHVAAEQVGRSCAILKASLRVELPWITHLFIAGTDGRISCATLPQAVGLNVSDRDYFQKSLETHEFVLSGYILNRTTKTPALIAAYPTSAFDGGPSPAVVLAGVNLDWLAARIAEFNGRPGVSVTLLDGQGVVLASAPKRPTGERIDDEALLRLVGGREEGRGSLASPDGGARSISFKRIPGTDLRMVLSLDEAKMLAAIDARIRWTYAQLAAVCLIVLLGAWVLSEHLIIRPIRKLTDTAIRFGDGDLAARSDRAGLPREFAPLARAFDAMAAQLADRERELRSSNNQLSVLASVDWVSGLANRRGFDSRLQFEWMKGEHTVAPVALLMIDIDRFKQFNDSYGHPEGDACLRAVGAAIARIAGEVGGFAARYGGEEFAVLLPGADAERAMQAGELVRAGIEALGVPHRGSLAGHVTASVGVASVVPGAGGDPAMLIEAADHGLYAAKRRGRNAVVLHGAIVPVDVGVALAG